MNVTFLIGNGFDLSCGLKTKFTDSYGSYFKSDSSSAEIKTFKKIMSEDIATGIDTWADFEMSIAKNAARLIEQNCLVSGVQDYSTFLKSYLFDEQFEFHSKMNDGFNSSPIYKMIQNFSDGIPSFNEQRFFRIPFNEKTNYSVINFNYTDIFDTLIKKYDISTNIIHIHGTLQNGMILGVDNTNQLSISKELSTREKRALVKPFFNIEFDDTKQRSAESIIKKSDQICIYGLSLGESDLSWKNAVIDWLQMDARHHMVYFNYELERISDAATSKLMDLSDKEKENILYRLIGNDDNTIINQIHVPVGSKFFNFEALFNT